jgi:hypothetical protein
MSHRAGAGATRSWGPTCGDSTVELASRVCGVTSQREPCSALRRARSRGYEQGE